MLKFGQGYKLSLRVVNSLTYALFLCFYFTKTLLNRYCAASLDDIQWPTEIPRILI